MLDLRNSDNRHEFAEKEVTGEKETERADIETYLPDRRCIVHTPGRRKVVAI